MLCRGVRSKFTNFSEKSKGNLIHRKIIPFLNLTFNVPKCLKYRNKGKDHNRQTQQYFIKFLKYIITLWAICFDAYRVIFRPSSCRSRHTKVYCIVGSPKLGLTSVIFRLSRCRSRHTNVCCIVGSPKLGLTSSHLQAFKV